MQGKREKSGSPRSSTTSTSTLLRAAFFALKRGAAPGVDGVTWRDYEADLEPRLLDLHDRVQRGAYRAQPARRGFIPKGDGTRRPLAISSVEDKIVQRAAVEVLNAIYEGISSASATGFDPGGERMTHWTRSAWGSPAPR